MRTVNIDLDQIHEIALKGIRRTAVFMGLGLNAGLDPNFNNYELSNVTQINIVPSGLNKDLVQDFKDNFCKWIISCGLRELVEAFELFLDKLHNVCSTIPIVTGKLTQEEYVKKRRKFIRADVTKKLDVFGQDFNIIVPYQEFFLTIKQARNCLTHRWGVVGNEDCKGSKTFFVKWRGIDVWAEQPSGEKHSLIPMPIGGLILEAGGQVKAEEVSREKCFILGSVVEFTPTELAEICWFAQSLSHSFLKSFADFARSSGIPVNEKTDTSSLMT